MFGGAMQTAKRLLSVLTLALGILAPFVALIGWGRAVGPYMDTSFEYQRLQASSDLSSYHRLVDADNQPPLTM